MPLEPPALPGMEEALVPDEIRDVGAIVQKKDYTCEQLRARHPGKYLLAVRAYFDKRRTAEAICDVLAISPNTMKAIIEQECAARGILPPREQIREKVQSARFLEHLLRHNQAHGYVYSCKSGICADNSSFPENKGVVPCRKCQSDQNP